MECFHSGVSTSASNADVGALLIKWIMLGAVIMFARDSSNAAMAKKMSKMNYDKTNFRTFTTFEQIVNNLNSFSNIGT